ncbi:uncharacterized protein LOC111123396 [Crassostrea virginica]
MNTNIINKHQVCSYTARRQTVMRTAAFLAVLVLGVALAQESPLKCYGLQEQQSKVFCSEPQRNCDAAKQLLEDWCDARLSPKIENNEYLQQRVLAFDLTNCLKARNQVDCDARNNCFWFRGNDCIPRDLVP